MAPGSSRLQQQAASCCCCAPTSLRARMSSGWYRALRLNRANPTVLAPAPYTKLHLRSSTRPGADPSADHVRGCSRAELGGEEGGEAQGDRGAAGGAQAAAGEGGLPEDHVLRRAPGHHVRRLRRLPDGGLQIQVQAGARCHRTSTAPIPPTTLLGRATTAHAHAPLAVAHHATMCGSERALSLSLRLRLRLRLSLTLSLSPYAVREPRRVRELLRRPLGRQDGECGQAGALRQHHTPQPVSHSYPALVH
eukprot:scaffold129355_cov63-Phaeocystis_antarctica.AAC.3